MRKAECACGQLSVEVEGEPTFTAVCSCESCQKRTGSAFGVSAYFKDRQILAINGESKSASRKGNSGKELHSAFCPDCGTSVYWHSELLPGRVGVAGGCFADPDFPKPQFAVWAKNMRHWIALDENIRTFPEGRPQPKKTEG